MKAEVKFWPDSKNFDLIITPETSTETALLGALKDRKMSWYESENLQANGNVVIVFAAKSRK